MKNIVQLSGVGLVVLYIAVSLYLLYDNHLQLGQERQRVLNIAYNLEVAKALIRKQECKVSLADLKTEIADVSISKVNNPDAVYLKSGEEHYIMAYSRPSAEKIIERYDYFSERVLSNYFAVIVDRQGMVQDMFWDKP